MSNVFKGTLVNTSSFQKVVLRATLLPEPHAATAEVPGMSNARDVGSGDVSCTEGTSDTILKAAQEVLDNSRSEAAQLLEDAKRECERMIDEASSASESIKQAAYQQGYSSGYDAGRNEAQKEYEDLMMQAEDVIEQAYREKERIVRMAEAELVDLSCRVASRIMRRETSVDRSWVLDVVRAAIAEVYDADHIEVHVHPGDLEPVKGIGTETAAGVRTGEISVISDPHMENGGCLVQTLFGTVDARVDTQLEEIRQTLREVAAPEL